MSLSSRAVSQNLAMAVIVAIFMTAFAGFAFVAFNTPHGGESNPYTATTNSTTVYSSTPISITSCYPGPCSQSTVTESMITGNGIEYVVVKGTTSENLDCTIAAAGEIYLTVVNSSNSKPVSGIHVHATETSPALSPNCAEPYSAVSLGNKNTNASGVITICCDIGSYDFGITDNGVNYNASASIYPEETTCVAMYIPSGKVNVTYSQPPSNACSSSD